MTQQRLNGLMILHVHKDKTDYLNLDQVTNDFIDRKEIRVALFGKCMYVASILCLFVFNYLLSY